MSKKEYPSVCILDCYFEQMNKDGSYYKISDKDLSKLVINIRELEFEREKTNARWNRYSRICNKKIKKLEHEKHVYKVELGRCVRKLTRIYQNVFKAGVLGYVTGITDITGRESVDTFKRM